MTCGASFQADFILNYFFSNFPFKFSISSQPDWQAETVNVTLVCALSWICLIHKCPQSLFLNKNSYVSSCLLKVINYPQKTPPPKVLLGGTLWGGTSWVHQSPVIRRPEVDFLAFTLKVVLIVTTPIHRNTAQALDAVRKDPIIRHQCTENCQTHKKTKCNFQKTSSMKMQRAISSLPSIIQMQMTQFLKNQCIIDVGIFWKA